MFLLNVAAPVRAKKHGPRGAATVEFALVAPVLLILVLGMIEFGRMMMVEQIVINGAREGARKAILPGATTANTNDTIDAYMANNGISGYTRQISPDPATAAAGTPVTVTVSVPYRNVSWLQIEAVRWLANATLTSSVEMRKEEY